MALNYEDKVAAVKNTLLKYNTTTAGYNLLAASLTAGSLNDDNIFTADIETLSIRANQFPCIFIRAVDKSEDFADIGVTGVGNNYKQAEMTLQIVGMYRKDGAYTDNATLYDEVYRLASNIENVFRQDMTMSGTAMWCQPVSTTFVGPFENNGVWIKGCEITLKAKYHFR